MNMEGPEIVNGIKGDAELDYRTGNVSLSPADIGMPAATVAETLAYLGIQSN